MPDFDRTTISEAFEASDVAATTVECGRILEDLVADLFAQCDGIRHYQNNLLNIAGSTEIDVSFWNSKKPDGFPFFPNILVAECKNTTARIGSADIRNFRAKLEDMKLDHGLLIAANGITGNQQDLRAAHDAVRTAFQAGVSIIVLTKAEISQLEHTDDLVRLVQDKVLMLTVQTRTFAN